MALQGCSLVSLSQGVQADPCGSLMVAEGSGQRYSMGAALGLIGGGPGGPQRSVLVGEVSAQLPSRAASRRDCPSGSLRTPVGLCCWGSGRARGTPGLQPWGPLGGGPDGPYGSVAGGGRVGLVLPRTCVFWKALSVLSQREHKKYERS